MEEQRFVSFGEAFVKFWRTWTCNGRSSRSEYWFAMLSVYFAKLICSWVLSIIIGFLATVELVSETLFDNAQVLSAGLAFLAFLIPVVCVTARRLHDRGMSGWWMLIWIVPGSLFETVLPWIYQGIHNSSLSEDVMTSMVIAAVSLVGFGLVGLVVRIALLVRSSQKILNKYGPIPNMPKGFGNICPNCESMIPEIADFCPECGACVKKDGGADSGGDKLNDIASDEVTSEVRDAPEEFGADVQPGVTSTKEDSSINACENGISSREKIVVSVIIVGMLLWALIAALS